MNNNKIPSNAELPSMGKLIKSTILASCIAIIILVTVVLPAEYGIDPTGVGNFLGLSKMGEIKVSLTQEAAADRSIKKVHTSNINNKLESVSDFDSKIVPIQLKDNVQTDKITFTLSPDEGTEIKLTMKKGEQVDFAWWTDRGRANFDTHADSKKHKINYHNYDKGSVERSEGKLEAAFDGKHGWFWRNRTSKTMIITLKVSGKYSYIKQIT